MFKGLIISISLLLVSNVAFAASKMTCISGTDDNYVKAEVTLDDKTVVFDSTLYMDGKKVNIGNDELIVLTKKGKVFYSKTSTKHFTFYRKALIFDNNSEIILEEAQISGGLLLSALSTTYHCTQR